MTNSSSCDHNITSSSVQICDSTIIPIVALSVVHITKVRYFKNNL